MNFFTKLLGIAPSQESSVAETPRNLLDRHCFCAALYCAANSLEKDPASGTAKAAFETASANVLAITARHCSQ